ncbi:unnamed protein product, partial [Rotaria sp. Silwood2]
MVWLKFSYLGQLIFSIPNPALYCRLSCQRSFQVPHFDICNAFWWRDLQQKTEPSDAQS